MSLLLEYPDKYRLWSDLIRGSADRVFIPTGEPPALGAHVPVKLTIVGAPLTVVIEGTIIGKRNRSARFPAGVYVRFTDEQIDACRRFLGLAQSPERYEQGRKSPRVRCELSLELLNPKQKWPALAKNISETGLLMVSPVELAIGRRIDAALSLGGTASLPFTAEVSWARNDKHLVGLRFVELTAESADQLRQLVQRLLREAPPDGSRRIVVADDEPNILEFLGKALSKHGYEVRKACRGEEALDLIREVRPDLVVLDILMPGIDGVDICKMMRADVEMAEIPVIFVSALEPARLHAVADEAGATDYLVKPVSLADLLNMVGMYLRH